MTDMNKEFEEWFESQYGKKPMPSPKNGDEPHDNTYMTMFADGAYRGYEAAYKKLEQKLLNMAALVAKKNEALEYYKDFEQHSEHYTDPWDEGEVARNALALTAEDVELVEADIIDYDAFFLLSDGPELYTIKVRVD